MELEKEIKFDLFKNIDQPPTFRSKKETNNKKNVKKDNIFMAFLKLMKGYLSKVQEGEIKTTMTLEAKEKKEIEKSASELLEKDDLISFNKLLNYGYQIPQNQLDMYVNKLLKLIDNNYDYTKVILNDFVKNDNIFLPREIIHSIFFNTSFQIYHNRDLDILARQAKHKTISEKEKESLNKINSNNKFSHLLPKVSEYLTNDLNKMAMFSDLLKLMKEYFKPDVYTNIEHSILSPYRFFEKHLIPSLNKNEIRKVGQCLQEFKLALIKENKTKESAVLDKFINNLDLTEKELNSDHINNLIEKTKRVYLNEAIAQKIEQKQKQHNYDIPKEANDILNDIYITYKKLEHEKNNIIIKNESHQIKKLIDERIPEILEKYISIDDEYKKSLINTEGKTPFDLMIGSLENILSYFKEINLSLNEEKVKELSVKERYTNQFKKS